MRTATARVRCVCRGHDRISTAHPQKYDLRAQFLGTTDITFCDETIVVSEVYRHASSLPSPVALHSKSPHSSAPVQPPTSSRPTLKNPATGWKPSRPCRPYVRPSVAGVLLPSLAFLASRHPQHLHTEQARGKPVRQLAHRRSYGG